MSLSVSQRLRVVRAFQSRPFTLVWTGQTISTLGDGAYLTALVWQVLLLTNSGTMIGLVVIAQYLPMLCFLLFGGVAADRLPQRLVMLVSDVGRGVLVMLIAVLAWFHLMHVWHLLLLAFCFGVVRGFFMPAYQAILPRLAEKDELSSVNALTCRLSVNLVLPLSR